MAALEDLVKTVNKLKGRLREATSNGCQEGAVRKVLQKLVAVPMSLELLQVTHVGKEVNNLRKVEGEIGRTAKQLVRSWKKLIPLTSDAGETSDTGEGVRSERETEQSLLATPTPAVSHASSLSPVGGDRGHEREQERRRSPFPQTTPPPPPPPPAPSKRKQSLDEGMASSKRSRTQVYSGKKTSGPQAVMSLFDLSMKILMDNIDAIEEVGGVPYMILEPLLQKCSATQLLRLEEFNPHFLEDSDVLWRKHCERDFKGVTPQPQQSWRQLYLNKLSDREERLRNITANIRKREEARKEPVRQVKLATATRAPGRRRQVSSLPLPSRPSLLTSRSSQFKAPPTNASKLKKQTMKMIKERSMMTMSRPGKR